MRIRRIPRFIGRILVVWGVMLLVINGLLLLTRPKNDGTSAWVAYSTTSTDLQVVRADGRRHYQLTDEESLIRFDWVTENTLIFGYDRFLYRQGFYTIAVDGQRKHFITAFPPEIYPVLHQVTPDGKTLYFVGILSRDDGNQTQERELYQLDVVTGQLQKLTNFTQANDAIGEFALSPDGQAVVMIVSDISRNIYDRAYLMRLDGTNPQAIRPDDLITHLRWLDQDWLVGRVISSRVPHLFKMRPDGSDFEFLEASTPYDVYKFEVSPNGQWIGFTDFCADNNPNRCIYQMSRDGKSISQINETASLDIVSYSPDGEWILYWVAGPKGGLWKMRTDGTDRQFLALTKGSGFYGAWSPPLDTKWGGGVLIGVGLGALIAGGLIRGGKQENKMSITIQQAIDKIVAGIPNAPFAETVDTVKLGDTAQAMTGIVMTFMATCAVIEQAIARKANFIITHEPTFYNHLDKTAWCEDDAVYQAKRRLIEENNLVIWRFHDYLHKLQPDVTVMGMLRDFGWEAHLRPEEYWCADILPMTLRELVQHVKTRMGLDAVRVVGNPDLICKGVAVLPGSPGHEWQIEALRKPDIQVLVCGEINEWETNEYTRDAIHLGQQKALVVIGHAASEAAGMRSIVEWLAARLPEMPIQFLETGNALQNW